MMVTGLASPDKHSTGMTSLPVAIYRSVSARLRIIMVTIFLWMNTVWTKLVTVTPLTGPPSPIPASSPLNRVPNAMSLGLLVANSQPLVTTVISAYRISVFIGPSFLTQPVLTLLGHLQMMNMEDCATPAVWSTSAAAKPARLRDPATMIGA